MNTQPNTRADWWKRIESKLEGLPPCPRAYALARAAYEAADALSRQEQAEAIARITADDPEPKNCYADAWPAWYDRNKARIDQPTQAIIEKHKVSLLRKLWTLAESNLVDSAEELCRAQFGQRFEQVSIAWKQYREGALHGETLEKFLKLCFNCPTQ